MARATKQEAPKVVRDEEGLARLRARGVTRALTLWPEWGVAFTKLDKRVENRPAPPFRNLIGQRIAFHMGKWIGGRKAGEFEGLRSLFATAAEPSFAWIIEGVEVLETPVACSGMQGVWTL